MVFLFDGKTGRRKRKGKARAGEFAGAWPYVLLQCAVTGALTINKHQC